jgi:beta-ureidopropionase / N-carbamoyl-L-amino-acid hydrolase
MRAAPAQARRTVAVPQIDAARFRADFDALGAIGRTPRGGVHRPTFSESHLAARAWFLDRAAAAGLETHVDAAGNHSALLRTHSGEAPTLLLGSHLDTVPNGGRYDGALGVLAALEVLRATHDAHVSLPYTLEAIDFTDEEGTLVGLLGSRALTGALTPGTLMGPRGGRDALLAGLARAGLTETELADARRDPGTIAGYLELHIEQGPVLEREGIDIGIVSVIVGSRSFNLTFKGTAGHAGTTPMDTRRDAGLAAARFVVDVHETVVRDFPNCVATVGRVMLEPGAFNVIAGEAQVALEFRSADTSELDALEKALVLVARQTETHGLAVEIEPVGCWEPVPLDTRVRTAIAQVAGVLGLSTVELPSGAGHDAQALAHVTPSGMILVPSVDGLSHQPAEHTAWADCLNGANVLLGATLELATILAF